MNNICDYGTSNFLLASGSGYPGCLQDLENEIVGYCRILKDNFFNFVGLEVGKM